MKVLFVITRAHEGGAQEQLLTLIRGLPRTYEISLATGEHGFLTERASALGASVHVIDELVTPIRFGQDWRAFQRIRALVRELKPDLIHTHSFKAGMLGRIAAHVTGTPSMFTAHGWAFTNGVPLIQRVIAVPCEWLLSKVTSRIITVSEADHRLGLQYRVARQPRMITVLNGVDPLPAPARRFPADVPRIVMVGRFEPQKDQMLLVRALREVGQPFEVWFIGDGSLRGRVEEEVRGLGLADRVRFFGTCRNVPELLEQADVFVLTSRYEGLPMSILEAMRAGLPVVATDVGGVSEAVREGVTGFLAPRGDSAVLRDRLAELLGDRELRLRMGAEGRRRFEQEFSSGIMVESTRLVYERVALAHGRNGFALSKDGVDCELGVSK